MYNCSHINLSSITAATDYKFPAMNPLATSAHGGDDVTIHSRGPWAHLLTGTLEQNVIAHAMAYASCVGTGATACSVRDEVLQLNHNSSQRKRFANKTKRNKIFLFQN